MRIKNRSFSALVVTLNGGRTITLPARGSHEISDEEFQTPEVQRLFNEGSLFVLPYDVQLPDEVESLAGDYNETGERTIAVEPGQRNLGAEPESGSAAPEPEKATKGPTPDRRTRNPQR
jgi:hypothetical protein